MELICAAAARFCWSSVSILPKVMSACFSLAASKTGPNIRHGPHHAAHQSTRVIPDPVTVDSKFSSVSATVLISLLLFAYLRVKHERGADIPARG